MCYGLDEFRPLAEELPCPFDALPNVVDTMVEHSVGELVGFEALEHGFDRIEFRAAGWQEEVLRFLLFPDLVPSRPIKHPEHGVVAGRRRFAEVEQMAVPFAGVDGFADMAGNAPAFRASGGEERAAADAPPRDGGCRAGMHGRPDGIRKHLDLVVGNNRFLLFPWDRNPASLALSMAIGRLRKPALPPQAR